jgi:2-oxoisovalerate dehydrogenase E2 component (dihydrolipoyl transacylase)
MADEAVREFLLPDLGEGLEDAEVVAWKVKAGDTVELNQILVEVNTAKALVEIPAPWPGVVETLHAAEGDVVEVGKALVSIRVAGTGDSGADGGGTPDAGALASARVGAQAAMETGEAAAEAVTEGEAEISVVNKPKRRAVLVGYGVEEEDAIAEAGQTAGPGREQRGAVRATPPVRRLAKQLGVDMASLAGTGPEGRITREDVEAAAGERRPGPSVAVEGADVAEVIPVRGVRRLIAEKMSRSASEIPHVTTFLTVDCHWLQLFREELASTTGARISPLPLVLAALCRVVREHPLLNATFTANSEIVLYRSIHVGIATDTDRGLIVSVVRDADRLGIAELASEIGRLAEAVRAGTARLEEVSGSTITVSNVGSFGSEYGTPIINHPESSILALGVIEDRALVVDGRVAVRPACTLSLSFDHRVMDGAQAGRALSALGDLLESPFQLGALPR